MNRTLLRLWEILPRWRKTSKGHFGNGYGENIYQKINADNRAVITYPADSGAKSGAGEAGFGQENEAQAAGAVSSRKKKECPPV